MAHVTFYLLLSKTGTTLDKGGVSGKLLSSF